MVFIVYQVIDEYRNDIFHKWESISETESQFYDEFVAFICCKLQRAKYRHIKSEKCLLGKNSLLDILNN